MDPTMEKLEPGNYIVVPGNGWIANVIRKCETEMYEPYHEPGWRAWAGHAGVYIGGNTVVAATWPKARIFPLSDFHAGRANTAEPLTPQQRNVICARTVQLLGVDYDVFAYPLFGLMTLHAATVKELDPILAHDKWRVCSSLVADPYDKAGVTMIDAKVPNLVTPEFLNDRIETGNWGHS